MARTNLLPIWRHPDVPTYTYGPMWAYPAVAVTDPGRHAKPEYDLGLDIIQGYLVAEGKRLEGKHRTRRST